MGKNNIIYLAPDIDISKNEWWKAHVLWEVKYFQNYYDKVFLISKNEKNVKQRILGECPRSFSLAEVIYCGISVWYAAKPFYIN